MNRYNYLHLAAEQAKALRPNLISRLLAQASRALDATYNYKGGVSGSTVAGLAAGPSAVNIQQVKLDFAAIAAARSAAGQTALTSTDVLEVFTVKAGTLVLAAAAQCTVVEGAALTIGVGDGAGASDFIAAFSLNSLAATWNGITSASSIAVGGGKLYTADDTVDVLVNTAGADAASVYVSILSIDFRPVRQ